MNPNVNVVYRDLDASPALNDTIQKKFEKLERFTDDIIYKRIVLDTPHNHKHKGKLFRASIELDMKGKPLTVSHDDESIHVAVRDAFNTAERKLKEFSERQLSARH